MGAGAAASSPHRPHPSTTTSEDKSFVCPVCQRVFNKKANLKVHSRKHTGEKPYVCSKPGCGRAFMWKSSVTFHEQNCPTTKRTDPTQQSTSPSTNTPKTTKRTKSGAGSARKRHKALTPTGVLRDNKKPDTEGMLPAAATLLGEKRTLGRPPVIPGVRGLYTGGKESGGKMLFDLRVPASSGFGKMMKMPIAMELDDSDDESPDKIVGAQDAFMRTGNPFVGFAPPTRCSPLPISSPIVPGISPMPLSPLAPFSPLPPDSPAHNAPNPVHPPVHTPGTRPHTPGTGSGW